ncbi:hypothetical protein FOXG_21841 [Fusarium oxysporum f. sp. lycopersici 4287]|uniref:HAT C-terminal dimerisation domain-containing protein n=1 Tax=Fusarium oxysporum f. sp. lycopersici (strain 4287 / CBS 123668 / FGSC 9935 / NRRL 34936) TaxID=426428 RepID=A0A0J9W1R2_FUSO4|nr:hypothetical protein FOXG_21841 [Fusarium oxysporum f. sp. lycopersici 4287]KNB16953.1 hypothetical protein FOXG_21841 [Fusarium oxysporum f. sp. lycopersici 4287]
MAIHAWFVHATDVKHRIISSITERCRRVIGLGSPLTDCSSQPSNRKRLRQTALAQHALCQVGHPPGSPLSPPLFLFSNADLVQHKIDLKSGSIAFIDDHSAWVTAPTAGANRAGIQAVIDRALDWERRSGATCKEDKTVIIHFTRRPERTDESLYRIKGQTIIPKKSGKIQGLVMDKHRFITQLLFVILEYNGPVRAREYNPFDSFQDELMSYPNSEEESVADEFERWQSTKQDIFPKHDNPLEYWSAKRFEYPRVEKMAIDVLSVLAMAAEWL